MKRLASWLHCPPMGMLIAAAVLLAVMPITQQPHLLQKLLMLRDGTLLRPLDMFDLFWHSWPMLWIVLRLMTSAPEANCKVKL